MFFQPLQQTQTGSAMFRKGPWARKGMRLFLLMS